MLVSCDLRPQQTLFNCFFQLLPSLPRNDIKALWQPLLLYFNSNSNRKYILVCKTSPIHRFSFRPGQKILKLLNLNDIRESRVTSTISCNINCSCSTFKYSYNYFLPRSFVSSALFSRVFIHFQFNQFSSTFKYWKQQNESHDHAKPSSLETTDLQLQFHSTLFQLITLKVNGQPARVLYSSSLHNFLLLLSASCVPCQRWPCLSQGWGPAVVWTGEREG